MTGDTAHIIWICQFSWYNWVMYHDHTTFPDDKALLGGYLGPAIDVGSMLTAKILKPNGQYVCRLTLWHLDDNEWNSEVHKANQLEFDQAIEGTLGTAAKLTDFDEQDLTPENIHYEGDANSIDMDHGNLEVTPEMGDNYIGAKLWYHVVVSSWIDKLSDVNKIVMETLLDAPILTPSLTRNPILWSLMTMTRRS